MKWLIMSMGRALRVCPECGSRGCPVFAALGEVIDVSPTLYMRHRGWWK